MCLKVFEEDAQYFKDRLFPGEVEQTVCYKVLLKPNFESDFYKSPMFPYHHNWKLGWNTADTICKPHRTNNLGLLIAENGIHVFLDVESAINFIYIYAGYYAIILVLCQKEDLILCNDNHAVFQKVFVSSFDEVYL